MSKWHWVVLDARGSELSTTESLASRDEAEAWMGAHWAALLEEGGDSVTLVGGGESIYTMGLAQE